MRRNGAIPSYQEGDQVKGLASSEIMYGILHKESETEWDGYDENRWTVKEKVKRLMNWFHALHKM